MYIHLAVSSLHSMNNWLVVGLSGCDCRDCRDTYAACMHLCYFVRTCEQYVCCQGCMLVVWQHAATVWTRCAFSVFDLDVGEVEIESAAVRLPTKLALMCSCDSAGRNYTSNSGQK